MNPSIDSFFESQSARHALLALYNMALQQEDLEGAEHFSDGIDECDLIIEHFENCLAIPSV